MTDKNKNGKKVRVEAETEANAPAAESVDVGATKAAKKKRSVGGVIAKYLTFAAVVLVLFWFGFTVQVREGNCAVILRFGAVREEVTEAGLYLKLPWPFEEVITYDSRVQPLYSNKLETTTKDKRNVILQSYVVWQISDPVLYHNSVGAKGSIESYINDQVFSATNSVLGSYELTALVSLEKEAIKIDKIQEDIFTRVSANCLLNYGVEVSDVSILRISLPDTNLNSVFDQMRADRKKDIDTIIANAQKEANKITSEADSEAAEIESKGETDAAEIKSQTETEVARIYAEAQAANVELYKFLKNLDTLVASVNYSTVLLVKADEYPFSILRDYSDYMSDEGDETIIKDLSYILTKLDEADRKALTDAIGDLIEAAAKDNSLIMP